MTAHSSTAWTIVSFSLLISVLVSCEGGDKPTQSSSQHRDIRASSNLLGNDFAQKVSFSARSEKLVFSNENQLFILDLASDTAIHLPPIGRVSRLKDHSISASGKLVSVSYATFHRNSSDYFRIIDTETGSDNFLRTREYAFRGGHFIDDRHLLIQRTSDEPTDFFTADPEALKNKAWDSITSLGSALTIVDYETGVADEVMYCYGEQFKFLLFSASGFYRNQDKIRSKAVEFITSSTIDGSTTSHSPDGLHPFYIDFEFSSKSDTPCLEKFEILSIHDGPDAEALVREAATQRWQNEGGVLNQCEQDESFVAGVKMEKNQAIAVLQCQQDVGVFECNQSQSGLDCDKALYTATLN